MSQVGSVGADTARKATKAATLHRAGRCWGNSNAIDLSKMAATPMLLIGDESASTFDDLDFE